MKREILAAAAALLTASAAACAQPYGPGYGMGPGGGYGPGSGPGMMGGYGPGYGMGPGMMGGGYGMGPGMMGGGYGPGYGMGPGAMGPGMMGFGYVPNLTPEQRTKLSEIQREFTQKHFELMGKMHSPGGPMAQFFGPEAGDEKSARQAYDAMAEAHKQMFEASLQMRKRMEAVLTDEQREQMRKHWRGGWSR